MRLLSPAANEPSAGPLAWGITTGAKPLAAMARAAPSTYSGFTADAGEMMAILSPLRSGRGNMMLLIFQI